MIYIYKIASYRSVSSLILAEITKYLIFNERCEPVASIAISSIAGYVCFLKGKKSNKTQSESVDVYK